MGKRKKQNSRRRPSGVNQFTGILYDQGGIENLTEANQLLESGYYRSLDQSEAKQIFPPGHAVPIAPSKPEDQHNAMALLLRDMFFIPEELQTVLIKAKEGPLPAWPHIFAALLRAVTDRWSVNRVLQALWWIWIWLITWGTITPSLRWPFISQEQAKTVIVLYMGVTLFLPLLIGLFTNTRNNEFWTILMAWQFRRTNTTVIPIYWWLFIFGVLAICQSIVWFIQ